jgi:TatA/E family protein of Tat protein translocase
MFGISFEHLLIVGVILLIVGPKRLPELGNTMGKAIKNFKDSFAGIEEASFKRLDTTASNAPASAAAPATASATEAPNQDAAEQTKSETHPKVPPVRPA